MGNGPRLQKFKKNEAMTPRRQRLIREPTVTNHEFLAAALLCVMLALRLD